MASVRFLWRWNVVCSFAIVFFTFAGTGTVSAELLVLRSNYLFGGSLSDSLGNGNDLVFSDTSDSSATPRYLPSGELALAKAEGLRLLGINTAMDYRIEMDLVFSETGGYQKLIDFKALSYDAGFYMLNGGLSFYSVAGGPSGVFNANQPVTIALERIGGSVRGFIDGISQFTFVDDQDLNAVSSDNGLYLFRDDNRVTGEEFAGLVSGIRVFSAVPEPGSLLLLATALPFLVRRMRFARSN